MNRFSSERDMTAQQRPAGGGSDIRILWLCGHRSRFGQKRSVPGLRPMAWRCAACAGKAA